MTTANALWDIPTRLFHWSLVVALGLAWWSAEEERYGVHEWTGYTIIVLVVSRIVWGFLGSRHSRFSDFLAGPRRIAAYLRGEGSATPGHNPLGGWSVLLLLTLLLLQAVSGLFNSDDILFSGPLYYAASGEFRDAMGEIHEIAFNVLLAFAALHVLAVCYYQFLRKDRLINAMLLGRAQGKVGVEAPRSFWLYLVVVLLVGAALWFGLQQAPQPQSIW
ncbi:cytochrome b/b6 domain-containing protein [Haliea sp. E17]|uniref:cytochrome b/b6 domain-containing protein n=1 Tax=Haliea sp. E17 TaxID=3401576 RepID=UPI003AAC1CBE